MAEYPKSKQLARGERRYRRKVASPKQWASIREEKLTWCRLCDVRRDLQLHHLLARSRGGDDVAENLVPLCAKCHECVTKLRAEDLEALAMSLTEAERAYVVGKLGEGAMSRLFGA